MSPRRRPLIRTVQFDRFGGVDVLELVEVEKPVPGPGEVVVEVLAAGVNHIEAFLRQGKYGDEFPVRFPARQGTDFSGIVRAIGEGVSRVSKNAEVLGHAEMGSHANFVLVPERNLVAKPANLSWEVAGSLFLAGVAAEDAVQAVRPTEGESVVITAAAGGVGSMEAYLSMHRGAKVIGTCGERNFDYLRSIGVKPVLYGDGLADRIRALAPGGVSAYIDNFGGDNRAVSDELGVTPARFRSSEHRLAVELRAIKPTPEQALEHTRVLAKLAGLAADRVINVLISGFYPFGRVREAFDDLEKHHARGKIVLGMNAVHDVPNAVSGRKQRELLETD
jgi:NADPH2:quinone reductase